MREKKSRAWDKVTETYLYSDQFPSMWQFYKELENRGIRHWETEDYTGLKDKNGKEIYEGDIVEISMPGFGICENRLVEWIGNGWNSMGEDYHREVIGNIWENKELLNDS